MARWTIGLVGLALGQGCATADNSDFTASSPFASAGQPGSADDGDASGDTGGSSDDAGAIETGDAPQNAEDGAPTSGPIDTGDDGDETGGGDPPPPAGDEGAPPPPPPAGACCDAQGMPGCPDANVAMCVCEVDSYCCETDWDLDCVAMVDELGCGDCGGAMPPAEDGGGGDGSCCMPTGVPGCPDPAVMDCVCGENEDIFCCLVEWDDVCASEVSEFGCGAC